jgi:Rieske Fe-S protein
VQFIGIIRSNDPFRVAEISFLRIDETADSVTLRDNVDGGEPRGASPRSLYKRVGHPHRRPHTQTGAIVTQEPQTDSLATRRGVLAGVGLVGLAGALTACGAGASSSGTTAAGTTPAAPAAPAGGGGASSAAVASALTPTSQVPVGGGKIFPGPKVVVTQPTAGDFKAFSAVCTHAGCIVNQISNGTIDCPCHGSQYSITTGDVLAGPAPKPLPAMQIKVSGDSIFLE